MTKPIYTVYQTINTINNKIYIGVHKTTNPKDYYLGSGTLIKRAIKKHGKSNFIKSILFEYDNSKDAYLKESQIVNQSFISQNNNYNLRLGGAGNQSPMYSKDNPNSDGKYSKQMWKNAPRSQHENQSKLCSKLNTIHKSKPKEHRIYNCSWCGDKVYKIEFIHHDPKNNYFCNATCRNRHTKQHHKN